MRSPLLPIGLRRDVLPIGLLFSRALFIAIASCPPTISVFIVGYPSAISAIQAEPSIASSIEYAELMAVWLEEPAIAAVLNSAPSVEVSCQNA